MKTLKFNKSKHRRFVQNLEWNSEKISNFIDTLVFKLSFDLVAKYRLHKNPTSATSLYAGDAGVLLSLLILRNIGFTKEVSVDFKWISEQVHNRYLESNATDKLRDSLYFGEVGVLFVKYLITKDMSVIESIKKIVEKNMDTTLGYRRLCLYRLFSRCIR